MLIDALQCGEFDREVFQMLQAGGYTCVTPTLGFWEGTLESMDNVGRWRDMERDNADLIRIVRKADDIRQCEIDGKLGILLGFQNTNCLEDRIRFVELFADMGTRVMQLTYNNQNELGGSCYEDVDPGLARFGKEVVREMNRAGILVDCSHVGDRTTLDAIEVSEKPIAVTHANARSLFDHKRNKSDDVIKALGQSGGVIGCAAYRNITGDNYCKSIEAWCTMVARTVDIGGIDTVAIGTDRSHNFTAPDYAWMRQGRWTRGVQYGASAAGKPLKAPPPDWFQTVEDINVIPGGLRTVGFNQEEIDKITHKNWLRLYEATFAKS